MIRVHLLAIPVLAAAPTLSAQTTSTFVVPPAYAKVPGNSLEQQVFGFDQSRYVQYVDKAELSGLPSVATLKQISYRREEHRLDKIYTQYEPMRKNASYPLPNWEIQLGNFTGKYDALNPAYESSANGVTLTTVFAAQLNTTLNNPTLSAPANASTPAPFAMKFPFNISTIVYSGAGLCVSHRVYATRNYSHVYYVDSILDQPTNGGSVDLISPTSVGCPLNFNRVYGTAPNPGAGDVKLHLFGAPASTAALAYLGGNTTTWNGANLPLNLGFMGMSACNIYTDLTFPVPATTDVAGISTLSIPVPANSAYLGATVYNQWAVADPRVNPSMGFALSDGVRIKIGSSMGNPVTRMTVISALGGQSRSSVGYIRPNQGAIFELTY